MTESSSPSLSHLWWNTNIPSSEYTSTCPSYLTYAFSDDRDRASLGTPDADFRPHSWPEVQQLVRENRLDGFRRVPSQLRAYRKWCEELKQSHGSVTEYLLKERVGWGEQDLQEAARKDGQDLRTLFEDESSYKILPNDWPYGLDSRISHLLIWTKFPLPADPNSPIGDTSAQTKQVVDEFVRRKFVGESEDVLWFRNWSALKSVHAVEHVHVLVLRGREDGDEKGSGD